MSDTSGYTLPELDKHGVHFLNEGITNKSCGAAISYILRANLDPSCPWKHIQLIINSNGGLLDSGFALIDIMETSKIPIRTLGLGTIASMGLLICMTGEKGHRAVTPKTRILSHQFTGGSYGKHHELVSSVTNHEQSNQAILAHYKKHTGLTEKIIKEKLLPESDIWLTASQAKKYNLIDRIANSY